MTEPDASRSPLALAALATVAVPGLDVVATRPPRNPGADFDVVGVMDAGGGRWIVRAPRDAASGAALEGEVALLAPLADAADDGRLPFDVPRPAGFAALPEGGRAMVYPELRGKPLPLEQLSAGPGLAAQVGRAIAALHELPMSMVADAGLPVYEAEDYRLRRLTEVDEAAATGHVPAGLLRRWERALEDVTLWRFRATPVHGDLAAEHILVAGGDVVAILDWSEARVADPADDLAWLLASAPEDSVDAILEAYALARTERSDEHIAARALLASELAVARWLLHGVRHRDGEIIDDAVQMLRELAEAVADEPPIGHVEPAVVPVMVAPAPAGTTAGSDHDHPAAPPEGEPGVGDEATEVAPSAAPGPGAVRVPDARPPAGEHLVDSDTEALPRRQLDLVGDDSDTAEHPLADDVPEFLEPDYDRTRRRGFDDRPTIEIPPTAG